MECFILQMLQRTLCSIQEHKLIHHSYNLSQYLGNYTSTY